MGLMLAQMMAAIEGTVVSTAMPTIATDLGRFDLAPWVFIGYLITSTACTPLWGKISDLVGRRRPYELAIVIFMLGALGSGAATSMWMLVGFRVVQGVGAGGLFALSMTIIGDVLSPRERGKYMGYMGGSFAVATVLGPLVGGALVDYAHWRWIFYMNLPLGVGALVMSHFTLRIPFTRRSHDIDYVGGALLVVWVVSLVLATQLGGNQLGWTSPGMFALLALGFGGLIAWLVIERRATEPIVPLGLFREPIVSLGVALQFFVGFAMFGVTISTPLFLQVVNGVNATRSGLLIVPLTLGMLITSITGGRRMTSTGRYRLFPLVGSIVMSGGMILLANMDSGTNRYLVTAWMFLFGCGVGGIMQITLTAMQNRVPHGDLGVVTSAGNFSRSLGSTFGSAIFGAVLINRLDHNLPRLVPGGEDLSAANFQQRPSEIVDLEPAVRDGVIQSFVNSLDVVFTLGIPFCLATIVLAVFFPEHPLRETAAVGIEGSDRGRAGSAGVDQPDGGPTVDDQVGAGHERAVVGRQEQHGVGQLP